MTDLNNSDLNALEVKLPTLGARIDELEPDVKRFMDLFFMRAGKSLDDQYASPWKSKDED